MQLQPRRRPRESALQMELKAFVSMYQGNFISNSCNTFLIIIKSLNKCRGNILSRTRMKKGPFKIGPPVIGYIFSYNQLCEVDHH